jgi:transcriptional regulator with XRE-family HTH domain
MRGKKMKMSKGQRLKRRAKRRLPAGVPNPVDVHVGNRVRARRTLLGLSQEKLGEAVGLTFQQIQKYERGSNRIGSSRLYQLSLILDVPIGYFFDDVPGSLKTVEGQVARGLRDIGKPRGKADPLTKRETLELVRAYYRISSPSVRKLLFEMVKACAGAGD